MKKSFPGVSYFTGHPTAANLLMLTFLFLGLITLKDLRRETFPDFAPSEVEIVVLYPGASAEDIEDSICQRIEKALENVTDVYEVRSESKEGQGRVVVEMNENGDLDRFFSDIKTEVEAIDDFPQEAEEPVIKMLGRTDNVVSIAVTGPMSVSDLKVFCEEVKDRLLRLPEISQVDILGFSEHEFRVEVPARKLMQFGLSLSDITQSISRQNVDLPAGTIETPKADVLIRYSDERRTVREYEDLIVISRISGEEVRLGDLARIVDRFEKDEEKILFNGKRAGLLVIKKLKSEDSLTIMKAVKKFLDHERQSSPPRVRFFLTQNMTDIVRDRLTMLLKNGFEGLLLVFLSLWMFFSFRLAFWVAMGLPVSFLAALFVMQSIDFSLNMLTMVGLLIALGLIMDDAIVISENVAAHRERGREPLDAAIRGTSEVGRGVFSSFLTTLAVFGAIPIFIKGDIGKVLWVMPVVLILTLAVSLIEAYYILPNHLFHTFHNREAGRLAGFQLWVDRGMVWIRQNVLVPLVNWAVEWRYLFFGVMVLVFLFSMGLVAGGKIKVIGFPEIDGDVVEARILLPQGTPIQKTEDVVDLVLDALDRVNQTLTPQQPEGQPLVQNVMVQFNKNIDAYEKGPHVATVSVDLLKAEVRRARIDEITRLWRREIGDLPDVISLTLKEPAFGPGGIPIEIRIQGSDLADLKKASLELQNWLSAYRGVTEMNDDLRPGKPEIRARMKRGALAKGLNSASIADQLRAAFQGKTASEVQVGEESYEVNVYLAEADQNSIGDFENFYVKSDEGKLFPIGTVATLEQGRGLARISRINGVRTITVQGDIDPQLVNTNELIADTEKRFLPEWQQRYSDLSVAIEGQTKESAITGASMRQAFLVGIFGIFILLSFQLRNYSEALTIMLAIPFAFIGVVWGHVIMGLDLSMVSLMGFVSLTGIVVNDSIVLVEFVRMELDRGQSVQEAAKAASPKRFRAVLLTSLTTIMGLVPLLLEKSLQAQVLVPLVTSIIFGLLASTVLILVLTPTLYAVLGDWGLIERKKGFVGEEAH